MQILLRSSLTITITCALFATCLSQTWIRQNPFPVLAQLQDIDFDGPHGAAVGDKGLCLITTDKGFTWHRQILPLTDESYTTAHVVPGTDGQMIMIGGNNLLLTKDGGDTWEIVNTGIADIYKIQTLISNTLVVLGANKGAYSADSGETWQDINMPGTDVSAGHFTDLQHGWVESGSFNEALVYVTQNGGLTWEVLDPLIHPVISSIHMLTDQIGFLAARDFVYKTIDGGQQWELLHDNAVNTIQDMHVVNENEIWTSLINGFIWHTDDGGTEWTETDPAIISNNQTNGIYANEAGEIWGVGKFVSILYYNADWGFWYDQIPSFKNILYKTHFINENNGIIGGSAGNILWTRNGGASWQPVPLGDTAEDNFFAVAMVDSLVAFAGSSAGKLWWTPDGGNNWGQLGPPIFGQLKDMHAFNDHELVVVNEAGEIWRTDNGGFNFEIKHNAGQGLLQAVHFVNDLGWACGWSGQILATNNKGETWSPQQTQTATQFSDIHFTTEANGWAVSSSFVDSVWHTQDGGTTWTATQLPLKSFWHGVSFHSPDTGWIAGGSTGSGLILRTNDAGQSWLLDHQSPEVLFNIFALPGKETAWSTGVGGNVVKYSPCTFNPELITLHGPTSVCEGSVLQYSVDFNGIAIFEWEFPQGWLLLGNPNSSSVSVMPNSEGGTIVVKGFDACNVESNSLQLPVTSIPVPTATITETDGTLICDQPGAMYEWYLFGNSISGAVESTYTPSSSGDYYCIVTFPSGCISVSNTISFIINSTANPLTPVVAMFPNPASNEIQVQLSAGIEITSISDLSMISTDGSRMHATISASGAIDITSIPAGVYAVVITLDSNKIVKRMVKTR